MFEQIMRTGKLVLLLVLIGMFTACNPAQPAGTLSPTATEKAPGPAALEPTFTQPPGASAELLPTPTPSSDPVNVEPVVETVLPAATATALPSPTPRATLAADDWQTLPVTPVISQATVAIFQLGLELGRDPHAFSKIGDCQNVSSYFLSPFAYPNAYRLGPYTSLQETIDWFQETGSFTRESLAVKGGYNVAAVLSPLRADPKSCQPGENPLACEIRVHNPSFAIISMETWWSGQPEAYEKYMRQLLDYTISQGVVPILATKADNLEGENQINKALAKLAWEYDIPLWNFWASVQDMNNKGLTSDGFHLTLGNYFYDDPINTATGWSRRNLTALQALDAVRRGVNPPAP